MNPSAAFQSLLDCKHPSIPSTLEYPHALAKISLAHHIFLCAIMIFATVLATCSFAQDIPIERAQRAYQARYHLITGKYVDWPPCDCGPAPNYPKNGFYGDLSKNREKALKLVIDLWAQFSANTDVYGSFLKDTFSTLEGKDTLVRYGPNDFPLDAIDESHYQDRFRTIESYINQLQYLPIYAHQTKADITPSINEIDYVEFRNGGTNILGGTATDAREGAEIDYDASGVSNYAPPIYRLASTDWTTSTAGATLVRQCGIIYADLSTKAELIYSGGYQILIDLSTYN